MKRVLCITANMNAGGAETFLMKMYRAMDKTRYQMDFCVNTDSNFYEPEILSLGGIIHKVPAKSQSIVGWYRETKKVVHDYGYKYIIRVSEHSLAALDLVVARQGGADHLIMRSSNASSENKTSIMLHKLFRFLPRLVATTKMAPSTEAAEYSFGKGCIEKGQAFLLNNAIDTAVYRYDPAGRERIREELGLKDKFVVGHVGRFNQQKNHTFLIDVFNELLKKKPEARLVLVGKGDLEELIRQKVQDLGIGSYVIFTGVRKDVPQLMSAFDVFLFPSLYEGMPNTVIEAQTAGLPCLVSATITRESQVTDIVSYLDLGEKVDVWASEALVLAGRERDREKYHGIMKENGYDINDCVNQFTNLVFG